MEQKRKIALVGNPNCGKSTLFNLLTGGTEYVGNRPGVTVAAKEGFLKDRKDIIIADTPGVYSLPPFSPDEKVTLDYLQNEKPDVIINLCDSRNLRRALFLSVQVLEMGIPTIVVLNSFGKKETADAKALSAFLLADVICVNAKSGENVAKAAERAVSLIGTNKEKLQISKKQYGDEAEQITARYNFVDEMLEFCKTESRSRNELSLKIDKVVMNKYLAFPIFFALVFFVYYVSVSLVGSAVSSGIETLFDKTISPFVMNMLKSSGCADWVCSLFQNAVLSAVFTVFSFLPQIFMLFFSLTLLEESGYMARAAFVTDSIFKKSALSGKSLISFLVGGACSVTGIMSARTIESRKSRSLTVLLTPFVPCSAKVTVIALVAQRNFSGSKLTVVFAFMLSFFAIVFSAKLLKHHRFFKEKSTFLLEIPPYSVPSVMFAAKRALKQSGGFVKKTVSVILISSVLLWALSYFGFAGVGFAKAKSFGESMLGCFGGLLSPLFAPLGFANAQCASAVVSGLFAKENIIGTLSMFSSSLPQMSVADALSFLCFNLFCPPCVIAVSTMKKELGSKKLTAFALLYQILFAYLLSLVIHFTLSLFS